MCQYPDDEGSATDWHLIHLGHRALSGAELLIIEATVASAIGRITPGDLGLYSDDNERALAGVLTAIRQHAPILVALHVSDAGRKASSCGPWDGGSQQHWPAAVGRTFVFGVGAIHHVGENAMNPGVLCRYITRPASSDERVQLKTAGQVELKLKTPWRDGTTHLVMSPLEFMQRLSALAPGLPVAGSRCPLAGDCFAATNPGQRMSPQGLFAGEHQRRVTGTQPHAI